MTPPFALPAVVHHLPVPAADCRRLRSDFERLQDEPDHATGRRLAAAMRAHLGERHDPAEHGRVADSITNDLDIIEWDSPTSDLWIEALYRIQNVLRETARRCGQVVPSQQRRHLNALNSTHMTTPKRPSRPTSAPRV